ncbi:hypothetical protein K469DRAFT_726537 [Zopfia rhizophila CBS 207.26]|uniref:Zn(2)-C6 fungal-type domain-containing protein n=1 Tax=Zopfia rhizophila CBS 207.26 TaxID=1314779 RepID=A0A6A6E565_9PEZI|nr:hypothetical protein K469DRAFT_726537 [Zopfia rhizophila CBS 207.26]
MLHGPAGTPNHAPGKSSEQQLNRACEACRLSKVRCLINPGSGSSQCQRCAKAGRTCVFAPPAKRRQRKRTDVRVAELEREVRQMRSLLRSNRISPVEPSDHESMDEDQEEPEEQTKKESPAYPQCHESTTTPANQPGKWVSSLQADDCKPSDSLEVSDIDIVDRDLISKELAEELLDIYRNDLVHECPGVVIPSEWSAAQLRAKKPALFHAVMAAASHSKGSALSNRLHEEVVYLYARSLFIKGEKSLQYIQALLVTVAYYTPPNSPAQLQIYQYGNMAASMALELGLASKPRTHEQLPKRAIRSLQRISSAEELLENCRTILVLYILTAGFAMRLRRPNILLYNSWMEECLSLLQKSPILDDRRIVAWLKLQRIADEAMTAFGFDDASTSFSLSELRLQVILRIFERRMQDWKKSVPQEVMSLSMMVEYHQNMISMWEFAMDGGRYDAPDFRNRHLTLPALDDDCIQPESLLSRSALQINATIKCISSAHSLLDCFMQLSTERLQKAPNVIFVRAIYALVALLKADYAVGTDAEGIGEVLDSQSLKVDYYLDTIIRKATEAIGPQKCRVPSHWLFVLNHKIKAWHDEHQAWRKEGRNLKRNSPQDRRDHNGSHIPPDSPSTASGEMNPQPTTAAQPLPPPSSTSTDQVPSQIPNFGMSNAYPNWPTNSAPLRSTEPTPGFHADQSGLPTDMSDFLAAFQNGDLYLWNDVNDSFGGWIPQGGSIYSDMQFGSLNNQGM